MGEGERTDHTSIWFVFLSGQNSVNNISDDLPSQGICEHLRSGCLVEDGGCGCGQLGEQNWPRGWMVTTPGPHVDPGGSFRFSQGYRAGRDRSLHHRNIHMSAYIYV